MKTIDWIEFKTSAKGMKYAKASITSQDGQKYEEVTIFSSFKDFTSLKPGMSVTGEIKAGVYNGKTSYTLENPVSAPKSGGMGIKAAQERKEQMIEKAQARKSESIAYFNAVNSAIALIGHIGKDVDPSFYKMQIVNWRDWFLSEWEKYDSSSDKGIPF